MRSFDGGTISARCIRGVLILSGMFCGGNEAARGNGAAVSPSATVIASESSGTAEAKALSVSDLPAGSAPAALEFPHFPSRFHAFVWRNWELVAADRMAAAVGARSEDILRTGRAMGLAGSPGLSKDRQRRASITIIRRNWHLLPYDQLLRLLEWTPDQMAFALREDDFLFIKLGSLKPRCAPLNYEDPDEETKRREKQIAGTLRELFPEGVGTPAEPLFSFVDSLSQETSATAAAGAAPVGSVPPPPRICYSYFALYGDPLLDTEVDPYPDALLARLAEVGVTGVWLQGMLNRLAPFPWDPTVSADWQTRMENLRRLTARAKRHGIGIYFYLNEPRAMPLSFHEKNSGLKGAVEGPYAALCTSAPDVQRWIVSSVAAICREAPDVAGFFTISASENLTNCWSHGRGGECPRCAAAGGAKVIADLHKRMLDGIQQAGSKAKLIAWDWGWAPDWAETIAGELPHEITLMSTSEWELPIARGGIATTVGEYSMSAVGPGPRAERHWKAARENGLPVMAKIQAGNTWELSAVPYIPVADAVARHCAALREAGVQGLLLGWTLGGYPSPNLEVATLTGSTSMTPEAVMTTVARRRYGSALAQSAVGAWTEFSSAFAEFPFHIEVVYKAPLQMGPANLLWREPTGFAATMVGLPYDDLASWRAVYPAEVFSDQLVKVADGFDAASRRLRKTLSDAPSSGTIHQRTALEQELTLGEAAAIHFRSAANQAAFVAARTRRSDSLATATAEADNQTLHQILSSEIELARRLKRIQEHDSRIGFEASNQYFYTPLDLAEKVLNCRYLIENWLPRL